MKNMVKICAICGERVSGEESVEILFNSRKYLAHPYCIEEWSDRLLDFLRWNEAEVKKDESCSVLGSD